jgi:hypothetical protein
MKWPLTIGGHPVSPKERRHGCHDVWLKIQSQGLKYQREKRTKTKPLEPSVRLFSTHVLHPRSTLARSVLGPGRLRRGGLRSFPGQ